MPGKVILPQPCLEAYEIRSMKTFRTILLLVAFVFSTIAAQTSAQARTITDIKVIPESY
jgi:hypothetical protein